MLTKPCNLGDVRSPCLCAPNEPEKEVSLVCSLRFRCRQLHVSDSEQSDTFIKLTIKIFQGIVLIVNILELSLRRSQPVTVNVDQLHLNETIGKQANDHEDTGDAANHSFVRLVSLVC
jgi:hypothetical protein